MTTFSVVHICGTVRKVDVATRGAKGFKVVTLQIDTGAECPVPVECVFELVGAAERLVPGDCVIVQADYKAREWQGKVFGQVTAASIGVMTGSQTTAAKPKAQATAPMKTEAPADSDDHLGSVPF